MKKPNIIVHLDLQPEESIRRIKLRNRDCESGISLEYMKALHAAYESFIDDIARIIPVIKVDYSRFRTAEEMAVMIGREYAQIANVRHVTISKFSSLNISNKKQEEVKNTTTTAAVTPSSEDGDNNVRDAEDYDRYAEIVCNE